MLRCVMVLLFVAATSAQPTIPSHPDSVTYNQLKEGWNRINPSKQLRCSDGSDYNFWFYKAPGRPSNKLMIEFEGGGACWNHESCNFDGLYNMNLEQVRKDFATPEFFQIGLMDKSPRNPLVSYDHAFIPYCTGDLHMGDAFREYASEGGDADTRIYHYGRFNVEWALEWLRKAPVPAELHLTGCSAGGYAAIGYAGKLFRQYQAAGTRFFSQHGDSAAGVGSEEFGRDLKDVWSAYEALPLFIPEVKRAVDSGENIAFENLYIWTAEYFNQPNFRFSQYNTMKDYIQYFFWLLMVDEDRDDSEWSAIMQASVDVLLKRLMRFRAFFAEGDSHCIVTKDNMYDQVGTGPSEGQLYVDWLRELVTFSEDYQAHGVVVFDNDLDFSEDARTVAAVLVFGAVVAVFAMACVGRYLSVRNVH